jgi:iron-sulfur cluster assembly protein
MITISEQAAEKVKSHLEKRGKGLGIRIGVKTTGCSGFAYVLEYVDDAPVTRDQFVYESNGIKIWVDGRTIPYIGDGLDMVWKRDGLNEGFDFVNPKETARCGCGESFRI